MKKLRYSILSALIFLAASHCGAQVITTAAGTGVHGFSGDGGPATAAKLNLPNAVAKDADGNLYISDQSNARIRKVSRNGIITTIAGTGVLGYTGDGGHATAATIYAVSSIAVDRHHNVYLADADKYVVRKIDAAGIITTVVGTGISGYTGDGGPATAATLGYAVGIAVDTAGNLYIADAANHVVRMVNQSDTISTFAGTSAVGYTGDGGPATAATFGYTTAVANDAFGNVYISDDINNVIRRVDAAGIIHTVIGNGSYGYSGDGGPATAAAINVVPGMAVDDAGNIYLSQAGNNTVRKVNAAGIISTVAGILNNGGYSGDNGPATAARLNETRGLCVDAVGNLYIADNYNHVIRKMSAIAGITHICTADTSHLYVSVPGGTWASSAAAIASVNAATGVVGGVAAGSATIYYSIGGDTASTKVVVAATPSAGVISGDDSLCITRFSVLYDTDPDGAWSLTSTVGYLSGNFFSSSDAGIATIHYTIPYSCGIAVANFPITVLDPNPGSVTNDGPACIGDTITFSSTVSGGVWTLNDTNAHFIAPGIVVATSQGFSFVHYTITTGIPSCTSTATSYFSVNDCLTGVAGNPALSGATTTVFPNPATDKLYLEMAASNQQRSIRIVDVYGRVAQTATIAAVASKAELKLEVAPGIYVLNIQVGDNVEVHKLVVQ